MTYSFEDDRWYATLSLDRVGEWRFTVEGWVDRFATWRGELEKKVGAGQDVASELLEGAEQVREAEPHARGEDHGRLAHFAELLGDPHRRRGPSGGGSLARAPRPSWPRTASPTASPGPTASSRFAPTGARRDSRPGTSSSPAPPPPIPRATAPFATPSGRCPGSPRSASTWSTSPRSIPSATPTARVPTTPSWPPRGIPAVPGRSGTRTGGHTAVNPALGTLADFRRFVDAARAHGMEVALDYALQCSPDHPWVREHPDWFFIRPDGTIKYAENPPKKYEDIYPINFWCDERAALWDACRDIFLFWIAQGVRSFRVDNPHTKPFAFWEWVIGEVQREHPDTVFLAEAFTRPKRMHTLAQLGFTQSYTYFTWRNTATELAEYLTELSDPAIADYFRGNFFANTTGHPARISPARRPARVPHAALARGHAVAALRDLQRIRAVRERSGPRGERGVSRLREVSGASARLGRGRQPRRRHRPAQPDPPGGARPAGGDQRELPPRAGIPTCSAT